MKSATNPAKNMTYCDGNRSSSPQRVGESEKYLAAEEKGNYHKAFDFSTFDCTSMSAHLSGLIAATFTPFLPDGSLNLPVVEQQVQLLTESGVAGVFVGGSTGESHSLTVDERIALTHKWCLAAKGKLQVVAHVGHNCLHDARLMATRAQVSGVVAIGAMAPFGFKPTSVGALVDYLAEIAAAAPALPFYYYEIPAVTGVHLPTAEVLRVAAERIPTMRGIKYTSFDLMTFLECATMDNGRFDLLYGHDELLLSSLALGADGAIGSTYNIAAPVYVRLWEAFQRGDLATARAEQMQSIRLIRALIPLGVLRAAKTISRWLGVDCGSVRPPLQPLSRQEELQLYAAIKDLPIFPRELNFQE